MRADQFRRRQPDEHPQECPYHAAESSHADSPGFGRALAGGGGRSVARGVRAHGVQMAGALPRAWHCRVAGSFVGGTASSACLAGRLDCTDSTFAAKQAGGRGDQTLQRKWAYAVSYASSEHRRAALPAWMQFYNEDRPMPASITKHPSAECFGSLNNGRRNHN